MLGRHFGRFAALMGRTLALVLVAMLVALAAGPAAAAPRNVILLIGDGMGFEHLKATSLYAYGEEGKLFMEQLPVKATVTTHPADGKSVPDSASTGTGLATGEKVHVGVVSIRRPGDGGDLETILEKLKAQGRRTGLVTTVSLGDATPATFAAHTAGRKNYDEIYEDIFERSRPNVMFGGGWQLREGLPAASGYTVVRTRRELEALDPRKTTHVAGLFSLSNLPYELDYARRIDYRYDRVPHLSEMAEAAVRFLEPGKDGFFLMIESGQIDHAAHRNQLERMVFETLEFDNAVKAVLRWAVERDDTLVLVTADHECGGLEVVEAKGQGQWPEVTWSTGGHTRAPVPLFAWGSGAARFAGELDNTDVPKRVLPLPEKGDVADARIWDILVRNY